MKKLIKVFKTGIVNRPDAVDIPDDSFKEGSGFLMLDGKLELTRGRTNHGPVGAAGTTHGVHTAFKIDGTAVLLAQFGADIKYLKPDNTWGLIYTLTVNEPVSFSPYSSLAGEFTIISSPNNKHGVLVNSMIGLSSLGSISSTNTLQGYTMIDKGRSLLWGRIEDKTGLYGSWIDKQNSTVYTTVTDQVIGTGNGTQTVFTGTATFSGNTAFGFSLKVGASATIVATDDYLGTFTSKDASFVSGTINYITGAFSVTFLNPVPNTETIKATFQHQSFAVKGVLDFSHSATRQAGEGFQLPQDNQGDSTQAVMLGINGGYISMKNRTAYEYTAESTDLNPTNENINLNIGVASRLSSVATDVGILFINTANKERPELAILKRNPLGDNLITNPLAPHFAWEDYLYDQAVTTTFNNFVLVSCRTSASGVNNKTIVVDYSGGKNGKVMVLPFGSNGWTKIAGGLYSAHPSTLTVEKWFSGFDDNGFVIDNNLEFKDNQMDTERLKKILRIILRGHIAKGQKIKLYASYDNTAYKEIGEIVGTGPYVDTGSEVAVGDTMVGVKVVGGGDGTTSASPYSRQLTRLEMPKFKNISFKIQAVGFGYFSIEEIEYQDILMYEDRLPVRFR